jgi:hypothetical protein
MVREVLSDGDVPVPGVGEGCVEGHIRKSFNSIPFGINGTIEV